jgi:predicted nuclease of predicted toxin-antitoxin system
VRVLLDECLPRKLKRALTGHEVKTVAESGWAGRKNGDLLRLAQEQFDVFITVDRNLAFQQDVGQFDIAVVVLAAYSNAIEDLEPLMPTVVRALSALRRGEVLRVSA